MHALCMGMSCSMALTDGQLAASIAPLDATWKPLLCATAWKPLLCATAARPALARAVTTCMQNAWSDPRVVSHTSLYLGHLPLTSNK